MIVHTNLKLSELEKCADVADCVVINVKASGSRKSDHKFTFNLRKAGVYPPVRADWNRWGIFFAELFKKDEHAFVGSGSISQGSIFYDGYTDFHAKTDGEFRFWRDDSSPVNPWGPSLCKKHKWENISRFSGIYGNVECKKCGTLWYPFGVSSE